MLLSHLHEHIAGHAAISERAERDAAGLVVILRRSPITPLESLQTLPICEKQTGQMIPMAGPQTLFQRWLSVNQLIFTTWPFAHVSSGFLITCTCSRLGDLDRLTGAPEVCPS